MASSNGTAQHINSSPPNINSEHSSPNTSNHFTQLMQSAQPQNIANPPQAEITQESILVSLKL